MTAVAKALVTYLITRPGACDTADGIVHWWFDTEHYVSPTELQTTLDHLVEHGLVEASTAADGRVRYRRRAELGALRAYLESA